ncbi:MAG TPA: hypothetical protein VGD14_23375, partial [bacterium]
NMFLPIPSANWRMESVLIVLQLKSLLFFWQKKIFKHEATKKPQGHKERLKRSFFLSSCVRRGGCPLCGLVLSIFFAASLHYVVTN